MIFESDYGGRSFERVGPVPAYGTLTDVAATNCECCVDDGGIHRYDGATWTPAGPS